MKKIEGIEVLPREAREYVAQFAYTSRPSVYARASYICRDGMCAGARLTEAITGRRHKNISPSAFTHFIVQSQKHLAPTEPEYKRLLRAIQRLVSANDYGQLRTRKAVRQALGLEV